MYLSDIQRGKCLEAVAAKYEIKRENRAKLKIRLIGLYNNIKFYAIQCGQYLKNFNKMGLLAYQT